MTDLNLGSVEKHFACDRGARVKLPFLLRIGGVAQDWTDWTARFVVAPRPGASPLLELTEADGITLGPTDGEGLITLTDAETAALPPTILFYRFVVIDGDGQDIALLRGQFQVRQT